MSKIFLALLTFFTKPLLDILLPHVIKAELTQKNGEEKKQLVIEQLQLNLQSDHISIPYGSGNITIPWREILPIIIDAIIKVLNIVVGRDWLGEIDDPTSPPNVAP